jgi:hypothetical protein
LGNDPKKWKTDIKVFEELYLQNVYKNIDLRILPAVGGINMSSSYMQEAKSMIFPFDMMAGQY